MESSTALNEYQGWLPILTSLAGNTLTESNWSSALVDAACFRLDALLMKPGMAFLKQLQSFKRFSGWTRTWVLNASLLKVREQDRYEVRSIYDGRLCQYSSLDVLEIIRNLKPHGVVLPQGLWISHQKACEALQELLTIYVPATDLQQKQEYHGHGVYVDFASMGSEAFFLSSRDAYRSHRFYIAGMIDLTEMQKFLSLGDVIIESDLPAQQAILGQVYSQKGIVNLKEPDMALSFAPIDADCSCPTCKQKFTRSYFHHLLEHTPLLCQRFLIQHNVHYVRVTA
jgi:queuine tRNA-ribosyltransferase